MGNFSLLSGNPRRSDTVKASWWISLLVVSATTLLSASAVDPGEDFGDYLQEMDRQQDEFAYEAKLGAHKEWRQTTWAGFFVRKIQSFALHFEPFLIAVQDALDQTTIEDGEKSLAQIGAYLGIRMIFVVLLLVIIYVGGKVIQLVIGSDIEIVQEVVVVHEHESEGEAAKARAATTRGKRTKQE